MDPPAREARQVVTAAIGLDRLGGLDAPALLELTQELLDAKVSLDTFLQRTRNFGLEPVAATRLAAAAAHFPSPEEVGSAGETAPRRGGTLRIGLWTAPEGLDPALATTRTSRLLTEQLYSTLTSLDGDGRPYPDLAEAIEVSDDARTYTFRLRRGVRFHDGSELTAGDVAASLERIRDPATDYHFEPWTVTMGETEAVDRYTAVLHLRQPTGPILTWLAFCGAGIVPAAALAAGRDLDREPIGSGPFRLAGGELSGTVRLERHGDHHDADRPYLDALEFVTLLDEAERAAALRTGRIDLDAIAGYRVFEEVSAAPNLIGSSTPDGRWHWLILNCLDPMLSDVRVRQAIGHAVDRTALRAVGVAGHGELLTGGPIAGWSWAADPELRVFGPTADPARARALLEAGGVAPGSALSIAILATLPILVAQADVLAECLQAVGLRPTVTVLSDAEWRANVRAGGSFQLSSSYWGSPINDPDDFLYMAYGSGARYDLGRCGTPALDELLAAGRASVDQATRATLYAKVQRLALEHLPLIPTIQPPVLRVWSRRLRNMLPLRNGQLKTLRDTWLEEDGASGVDRAAGS